MTISIQLKGNNRERFSLCTVTSEAGHGGIARVSSLLWRVMQGRQNPSCELLTAVSPGNELTLRDKTAFSATVILRQIFSQCDALVFDHLGLARVQPFIPQPIRRPYAVFLHSIEAWEVLSGSRLKALREATLRIANSHYTADRIAEANPGVGPIEVCHLALNPELTRSSSDAEESSVKRIRPNSILIVGRMLSDEKYKGHDQLIRSLPLIRQRVPDAQLVIVGRGDDVLRLKALAAEMEVSADVLFTGPVSDSVLWTIYERVAVFAMPSRAEGFGLVYLEAMQHRLACVGSIHDAAPEIIVEGETGFLVDQSNIEQLATVLTRLLTDRSLRDRLGHNGFNRLQAHFSFARFESRVSTLLNALTTITHSR